MRINKEALRRIIKESRLTKNELSKITGISMTRIINMFAIQSNVKKYNGMTEIEQLL